MALDVDGMTRLLEDFAKMKKAKVWLASDPNGGKVLNTTEAFASGVEMAPRDDEGRLIASPDARVVPLDEEALRGRYYHARPANRVPLEPQPQATGDAGVSGPQQPLPAKQDDGPGFDWQRGLAGLVHGVQGIQAVDSSRAQKAQTALAQERDNRAAQMDQIVFDDRKREHAQALALVDPNSPISQQARESYAASLQLAAGVLGNRVPGLGAQLAERMKNIGGMSAAQVAQSQKALEPMLNLARQISHDMATEAMTKRKLNQGDQTIAALERERAEKRAEREEARTEKDTAAYGKEVAPIDDALFNADDAIEAKKKVSTGKVQNFVHEVRKALGMPNKDMVALESAAGALGAGIRHAISGGAVTPDEGKYLLKQLAELDQSDSEYDIKLQKIRDRLMRSKKAISDAHPRATQAAPGAVDKKAQAREWLKNNPDHPMAESIRKKLEGL